MAAIVQEISEIANLPIVGVDVGQAFATKGSGAFTQLNIVGSEINTFGTQANDLRTEVNSARDTVITQAGLANTARVGAEGAKNDAVVAKNDAVVAKNDAEIYAVTCAIYANIGWAGFTISDGELYVNYIDGVTSAPSLVDGEFIITY